MALAIAEGRPASRGMRLAEALELVRPQLPTVREQEQVSLLDGSARQCDALCYLADRGHPQYAGRLSLARQAALVRAAVGLAGGNVDYVLNTVRHLEEVGIHDAELAALAKRLTATEGGAPKT